jgi:hypothetical protein
MSILIFGMFDDAFQLRTASNGGIIVNNESERIWKALPQYLSGESEENHEKPVRIAAIRI